MVFVFFEGVDLYHSRYSQNHPNSRTSKLIRNSDFKQNSSLPQREKKSEKKDMSSVFRTNIEIKQN